MKISLHILALPLVLATAVSGSAQTVWHVDDDCAAPGAGTEADPFCTIQSGVNSAVDGDTVLVAPGIYTGTGNRDISLFGKRIMLKSLGGPAVTTIDSEAGPGNVHRGFFLVHGETFESVIDGFTITGGYLIGVTDGIGNGGGGAAIYIRGSSPTVRNCIIRENISATLNPPFPVDGRGGGIYVDGSSGAVIEDSIIVDNHAERRGGGIMLVSDDESSATIRNCVIGRNTSGVNYPGGGIKLSGGTPIIVGCVIADNEGGGPGGGIHSEQSEPFLSNCVLWGNQAGFGGSQIHIQSLVLTIQYSDVQGGLDGVNEGNGSIDWGPGMIDADPLFSNPENNDYHLLHGSPCIDAGDNLAVPEGVTTDLDGGARFLDDPDSRDTGNPDPDAPDLPIVDMGPYEFDHLDCNHNGVPDEREPQSDCNENGVQDICDIGVSEDCNDNDIPDECELDTDGDGAPDECDNCELFNPDQADCQPNGIGDVCDIVDETSADCNDNAMPDECEEGADCNGNGQFDSCDLAEGISVDCFGENGFPDGVPDECCPGDVGPGQEDVGAFDLAGLLGSWGACPDSCIEGIPSCQCTPDFDRNCIVNAFDLAFLLGHWGPCP